MISDEIKAEYAKKHQVRGGNAPPINEIIKWKAGYPDWYIINV